MRAQLEHTAWAGILEGWLSCQRCQMFLSSCFHSLCGDGPAKQKGRDVPVSSPVPSPCGEPFPLTPSFSPHADSPLGLTLSIFRFVNTAQKAPARLCCFPGSGLGDILPFGCPTQILGVWVGLLSFNLLVLRFGFGNIWEIWKILVPGSLSPKF